MTSSDSSIMSLQELHDGLLPGLSPAWGAFIAEAAAVCFENRGHCCGVSLRLRGAFENAITVSWPPTTESAKLSWSDLQEATEYGAYAVAILPLWRLMGFTVLRRSYKGPGFDFWIGPNADLPMQEQTRLEVSGILDGTDTDVKSRTNQKLSQITPSDDVCPGYVVIVEFGRPLSQVTRK